jgi:hypothetical protein
MPPTHTDAQGICLRLLTARPRSRAELADALRRRGIPDEVSEPVLDRLSEVGLVNDAAFAAGGGGDRAPPPRPEPEGAEYRAPAPGSAR